jgi:membrane protein insertase Oxa1/YidC/SpoIIIJ
MSEKTKNIIEAFLKVMLCMFCAAFLVSFALAVNIVSFAVALVLAATFIQNAIIFMRLKHIENAIEKKTRVVRNNKQ